MRPFFFSLVPGTTAAVESSRVWYGNDTFSMKFVDLMVGYA